ncbi:hypothetical protein WJX75_004570 [Coccomyxa subellipsoidea]|uniref:Uncharacterized protein n=1 Tax=Coccomyxa subellipsoidea TaxID=248742 RepID=A0ABR2YJ89_9CHLO
METCHFLAAGCGTTLTPLCEFVESIVNNQEARNLNRKGCMPVPTLLSSAFQSKQKSRNSFNRGFWRAAGA